MDNGSKFSYVGEVTIRYKKNGKIIELKGHNEGFEPLFKTIASLLAGEGFPYGAIASIGLKKALAGDESDMENLLNSESIPITQQPKSVLLVDTDKRNYACSVNTTISDSDMTSDSTIRNITVDSDKVFLYLLSSSGVQLARVELVNTTENPCVVKEIKPGVQLFIQWNLITDNPSA